MDKTYITKPTLPDINEFMPYLRNIWDTRLLTNNGPYHQKLEKELSEFLGVPYVSLFANGTLALVVGLKAMDIKGEVITSPFSFVATSHALVWNNLTPVFADIDVNTGNLDPSSVLKAITKNTTAILPVHVYGHPCDHAELDRIAKSNNLKIIYDAAHAFGVKQNGISILNYGELSILSFHATKVFHTFEGGAIISHSPETKQKIDHLKNFGFRDEVTVVGTGINGKMNEFQAIIGLLNLKYFEKECILRKELDTVYRTELMELPGLHFFNPVPSVEYNYSYFPVLINERYCGISRDSLYLILRNNGFMVRRYFYPLISNMSAYKDIPSATAEHLPVANKVASEVLCLPMYSGLCHDAVKKITGIIKGAVK